MTEAETAKLPENDIGEKEMAEIACIGCGTTHLITHQGYKLGDSMSPNGKITGVLECYAEVGKYRHSTDECNAKTLFEITRNVITFYPGKGIYGTFTDKVPEEVKIRFLDAQLCYYGTGFRGSVAMSRVAVEKALVLRGYTEGKLEEKIDMARKNGILTDRERMLAHGSRLVGNDALHEDNIDPASIPSLLSAVVSICNHLYP